MTRFAAYTAICIVAAWSILAVVQLWFEPMSSGTFWKVTLTMAILGGGAFLASLIAREYLNEKELRKNKYID